jgi:glucose/mannose-6-phosphate isomerase
MVQAYLSWPKTLREGFEAGLSQARSKPLARSVEGVVVCGMGGSGIVGDYASRLADEKGTLPVIPVKTYRLPVWARRYLVVAVSFSGNTAETVSCFRDARRLGAPVAVVAGGGRLAEMAREAHAPLVQVPSAPAARAAFAQLLGGLLGYLDGLGLLDSHDEVYRAARLLRDNVRVLTSEATRIARLVDKHVPVFITCSEYEPLAWRAKNEFNENAKVQGKVEVLPEWGHNDVEGWEQPIEPTMFAAIALDPGSKPCTDLLKFALELLSSKGVTTVRLLLQCDSLLEKLVWGSLVVGLASLELAKLRGVDPLETPLIRRFRGKLVEALVG